MSHRFSVPQDAEAAAPIGEAVPVMIYLRQHGTYVDHLSLAARRERTLAFLLAHTTGIQIEDPAGRAVGRVRPTRRPETRRGRRRE